MFRIITIMFIILSVTGEAEVAQPAPPPAPPFTMPPNTAVRAGHLSAYADGVMDRVIAANDIENFYGWSGYVARETAALDGYIAVAHCDRRGQFAAMTANGRAYRVMVADCLAAEHRAAGNIFDRPPGYVAEVDYDLGRVLNVGERSVFVEIVFDE